ncbi:MAG: hypothetical protein AB2721_19995 [Candidatus Thiodiazotropha sp.]
MTKLTLSDWIGLVGIFLTAISIYLTILQGAGNKYAVPESVTGSEQSNQKESTSTNLTVGGINREFIFETLKFLQWGYDHIFAITTIKFTIPPAAFAGLLLSIIQYVNTGSLFEAGMTSIGTLFFGALVLYFYFSKVILPSMNRAASNHFWFQVKDSNLSHEEWCRLSDMINNGELTGGEMFHLDLIHPENKLHTISSK